MNMENLVVKCDTNYNFWPSLNCEVSDMENGILWICLRGCFVFGVLLQVICAVYLSLWFHCCCHCCCYIVAIICDNIFLSSYFSFEKSPRHDAYVPKFEAELAQFCEKLVGYFFVALLKYCYC